jgi:hypothetical protein
MKFAFSAMGSERRLLGLSIVQSVPSPLMRGCPIIRQIVVASLLWTAFARATFATGAEPVKDLQVDPAACSAAAAGQDDDKTISVCGALIDAITNRWRRNWSGSAH